MDKKTILVVDDDPGNIDLLVSLLKDRFNIKAARNGSVALNICRSAPPDLVLLDIVMPEMDGYEVCRRLKADPSTIAIPVIFLTAEDDVEAAEFGAVCSVTKPVNPDELIAMIKLALGL